MTRPQQRAEAWPPAIEDAAYHGILGEIVREIAPHTEADPVGILAVLLSGVGNALGRTVHALVGSKPHHARLNTMLVGETRQGAKGSAQSVAEHILELSQPDWYNRCRATGLSTGEGLIKAVRDERKDREPIRDKGKVIVGYQDVVVDVGVQDKRLWVFEEEFDKVIKVMGRESNTLSSVIREAWDGGTLQVLTSGNPYRATAPHISLVAHTNPADLKRHFTATDAANGFANRFLWFAVRRQRYLPDGATHDMRHLSQQMGEIIDEAREGLTAPLQRDEEARKKWHLVYAKFGEGLTEPVASILSRAEAQTLRLSLLYAALDLSPVVSLCHLDAALAVWRYCHNSALVIFGDQTGDPVIDTIVAALRKGPKATAELSNHFNRSIPQLGEMLELMQERGIVQGTEIPTGGRPRIVWELVPEVDEEVV